jgi:membrane protein implicated in regulation of membrane protease activity
MDSTLAKLALIAIALGITTAIVLVVLIALGRWRSPNLSHNSMNSAHQWIGQRATVELPCTAHQRGKVRIDLGDRTVEMPALTYEGEAADRGQAVLVIAVARHCVWITPEIKPEFPRGF